MSDSLRENYIVDMSYKKQTVHKWFSKFNSQYDIYHSLKIIAEFSQMKLS